MPTKVKYMEASNHLSLKQETSTTIDCSSTPCQAPVPMVDQHTLDNIPLPQKNDLWNPRDFPKNVPQHILERMFKDEKLLHRFYATNSSVFDSMPFLGMKDNLEKFTQMFAEESDDDFAACTLINVEFFAALIYHGWLITAHGMIQRPGTPFYFQHNRFGLCSPLPDDPLKFASMGKEAYCIPLILPKLHVHRSLISLSPMGVVSHKSDIKRSRDYFITFNCAFNITTQNCIIQHGGFWLIKELRECYSEMHLTNDTRTTSKVISIEVWARDSSISSKTSETLPKGSFSKLNQAESNIDAENPLGLGLSTRLGILERDLQISSDLGDSGMAALKKFPLKSSTKPNKNAKNTAPRKGEFTSRLTPSASEEEINRVKNMYRNGYVLLGGEIGTVVGSIYTSLTGWRDHRRGLSSSAGTIQLLALGHALGLLGFTFWDMGQTLDYKDELGCVHTPRQDYLTILKRHRDDPTPSLPSTGIFNAKKIIQANLNVHKTHNNIKINPSIASRDVKIGTTDENQQNEDENENEGGKEGENLKTRKDASFVQKIFLNNPPPTPNFIEDLMKARVQTFGGIV